VQTQFAMATRTDPGRVRPHNQDCVHTNPQQHLFVLADGVGGHAGGEVASRLAVDTIDRELLRSTRRKRSWPYRTAAVPNLRSLTEAVLAAHRALLDRARVHPELKGMGCTVVAGCLLEDQCLCVAVGDSRLYRLREGRLEQITEDQTLARRLLSEGFLEPGDQRLARYEHVLTAVLGGEARPEVQQYRIPLQGDDLLLACSDGLSDMLSTQQIAAIIGDTPNPDDAAGRLVEEAKLAGGRDNISVIVIGPRQRAAADGHAQS
jgi:PPM family protein phosphatase